MTITSKTISLIRNSVISISLIRKSTQSISLIRNSVKSVSIKIGKFFQLRLLGYFDPYTLSTWDSVLLGDMDGELMP